MQTKQGSKQGKTATAVVMDEKRDPVGSDKETALRGAKDGVTVTAQYLAAAVAETKAEMQASAKRAENVMNMLTRGTKESITEALRPSKVEDGNRYAIEMPVLIKGSTKQAHGPDGKPLFERKAQPPMVYFLVTERGMELASARVRVREVRSIRAALSSGEPFNWQPDGEVLGWGPLVRLADKVNKDAANKRNRKAADARIMTEYKRMLEEQEIPSIVPRTPDEAVKMQELYEAAKQEVASDEQSKAAEDAQNEVKRIAARIIKDRGYELAQQIAQAILDTPKEEADEGQPSVALKEAVAGSLKSERAKARSKAAKVAVH